MNGALCSQSEAHPWWKLLKTIAGIEVHELIHRLEFTAPYPAGLRWTVNYRGPSWQTEESKDKKMEIPNNTRL